MIKTYQRNDENGRRKTNYKGRRGCERTVAVGRGSGNSIHAQLLVEKETENPATKRGIRRMVEESK